jgi:hypothetical protein
MSTLLFRNGFLTDPLLSMMRVRPRLSSVAAEIDQGRINAGKEE